MCNNAVGWLYARGVVEEDGEKKPIMNSTHREVNTELYDRVWSGLYRFNKRHTEVTPPESLKSLVKLLWAAEAK